MLVAHVPCPNLLLASPQDAQDLVRILSAAQPLRYLPNREGKPGFAIADGDVPFYVKRIDELAAPGSAT